MPAAASTDKAAAQRHRHSRGVPFLRSPHSVARSSHGCQVAVAASGTTLRSKEERREEGWGHLCLLNQKSNICPGHPEQVHLLCVIDQNWVTWPLRCQGGRGGGNKIVVVN